MEAEDGAMIEVTVPADAQVKVNDQPTTSTGTSRSFVSRGLQRGKTYTYQLAVSYDLDGETIVETKSITLRAGDHVALEFPSDGATTAQARTELKLAVPAEAKVYLAGAATEQTGAERTYITQRLTAGQEWDGYVVRVELERDGKQLVEERTLKIIGGESYQLAFQFDEEPALELAQLN
jgi:uncharacterized protein (TIGR03000 family)